MFIDIIAGARPNFVKIAPILDALSKCKHQGRDVSWRLIHTGQHYDKKLSGVFFTELGIPEPDINFNVGSGSLAEQTSKIMLSYEKLLDQNPADICLVVGDVTSTMACSIVAIRAGVPVAHVEAGIRSYDMTMPEELNRMVTDSIASLFFTTTEDASQNLRNIGIKDDRIFFVGNTMIDTLLKQKENFTKPAVFNSEGLTKKQYFVLTLHRPSNVDELSQLAQLVSEVCNNAAGHPVIFPIHPRTQKMLGDITRLPENLVVIEPLSYLNFNYLVANAKAVLTDSGGITEETTVLGIPCITLRDSTERPETVTIGTNVLIGNDMNKLKNAMGDVISNTWKQGKIPDLWDGLAAKRIVDHLVELFESNPVFWK